jgi:hypothetical protein
VSSVNYGRNLARKGPRQVWSGYRNLRVPIEVFEEVKHYLERKKQEHLLGQEGLSTDHLDEDFLKDDGTLSMGSEVQFMIQQVIREELDKFKESGGTLIGRSRFPERKKTSKERIKELLVQHNGEVLTTIQIAEVLDLPAPTCRQSTRELAEEDETILQYPGRPNKYRYYRV